MKKVHRARHVGDASTANPGVFISHVATNQEALQTLSFGFLWSLHCIGTIDKIPGGWSLIQIFQSFLFPGGQGEGLSNLLIMVGVLETISHP